MSVQCQNLSRKSGLIGLAFVALLGGQPRATAASGVEASQLEYVSLGSLTDCTRIFLRSTRHFQGTIFMLPKVIVGSLSVEDTTPYYIQAIPGTQEYNLYVRLSFPVTDARRGGVSANASTISRDYDTCNDDTVLDAINRDARTRDQRITKISPLPLIGIEVSLPGVIGKSAMIGSHNHNDESNRDVSILDYNGKTMTAVFRISENERALFQEQLMTEIGIPGEVRFHFLARVRNGSVHAQVDLRSLMGSFQAAFKGSHLITKAQLRSYLSNLEIQQYIKITSEEGTSDVGRKISDNIIEMIQKEFKLGEATHGGSKSSNSNSPYSYNYDSNTDSNGDMRLHPSPVPDGDSAGTVDTDSEKISINAVLDVLSKKVNQEIVFEQISAPEKAVAQTEITLRSKRLNDPNVQWIKVASGYRSPTTGISLAQGMSTSVSFYSLRREEIQYIEEKVYLTESDLHDLHLEKYFPDIMKSNIKISNQTVNDIVFAVGEDDSPFLIRSYASKIRWYRINRYPQRRILGQERETGIPFKQLSDMGLGVNFSSALGGGLINFERLMKPSPFWEAKEDPNDGKLIITAKQNLGSMYLRESMNDATYIQTRPVVLEEYVQEVVDYKNRAKVTARYEANVDKNAISLQTIVMFRVTRPVRNSQEAP